MKKALITTVVALALSGCNMTPEEKNGIGGVLFGAGAVAICAQSGLCAFPL